MKNILTIAGLDPSGGAGIIRDIKTIISHSDKPLGIVSTLTIQNESKVSSVENIDSKIIANQLQAISKKHEIHAIKIGLISSVKTASIVAKFCNSLPNQIPIVFDPVYISSSGFSFMNKDDFLEICSILKELSTLITPNKFEAETLSGIEILSENDFKMASLEINYKNILIKSGHFNYIEPGVDFLYHNNDTLWIRGNDQKFKSFHGTGCTLSTAITCNLANNLTLADSIKNAKKHLESLR